MDAEVFKKQYLPCHQKLFRVAFRLLGNSDDAEDIVQEAYLKLWNKRYELDEINNPESFSVTILKNLCFDYLRSNKHYINNQSIEELNIIEDNSLSDEIECRDEFKLIKKLIVQLPPQQQKVMALRHINDCSLKEIEIITGLNSINVRTLLSRARKKIREQFEKKVSNERRGS